MAIDPLNSSYWNSNGKHQKTYDALVKLIPPYGECPADSPKLERLRHASNAYYQLYNNGRASGASRIFGVAASRALEDLENDLVSQTIEAIEAKLDSFIMEATEEQLIKKLDGAKRNK
jgi:hypothetical protein